MRFVMFVLPVVVACSASPREQMAATGSRPDSVDTVSEDDSWLDDVDRTAELSFSVAGAERPPLKVTDLIARFEVKELTVNDPYDERKKRFAVVPLLPVLLDGLGFDESQLAESQLQLDTRDGAVAFVDGKTLMAPGAWLALDDLSVRGWQSLGDPLSNPGPLYLVWSGNRDPSRYRWQPGLTGVRVVTGSRHGETTSSTGR